MIAGLYFFDHSVASQMAQQKEFNLKNPPAYHYDILILGIMLFRKRMIKSAKECMKQQASNSEIYGRMQAGFIEIDATPAVNEQRLSNIVQSILVVASLFAMAVIKKIPTSVLWGYFAYKAIDSLPGNQFWERMKLLFITPGRRYKVLEEAHASFVESVPYKYIATFTLFQLMYLLVCFGVTWIPIAGILFPLSFFLLISIRQHILPKLFHPLHLHELDVADYEEISGVWTHSHGISFKDKEPNQSEDKGRDVEMCDAEILDELTTSRGELKLRSVSFSDNVLSSWEGTLECQIF